jgi:DNA-binding NarL/FixJ family response regulator
VYLSYFSAISSRAGLKLMTTTTLIVEDHPLYRGALVHLMHVVLSEAITLEASSAEEGLRMVDQAENLAVIMLDLGLPGLRGVDAIASFRYKCPSALIVVVSASEDRRETMAAIRSGAKVVLSKAVSTEVMADIMRRLLNNELLEPVWITANGKIAIDEDASVKLTPRQQEILVLLSYGQSNKEIGLRLGLAEITVKMHVSAVFRTLKVVNRTQAVSAARRLGLYQISEVG